MYTEKNINCRFKRFNDTDNYIFSALFCQFRIVLILHFKTQAILVIIPTRSNLSNYTMNNKPI